MPALGSADWLLASQPDYPKGSRLIHPVCVHYVITCTYIDELVVRPIDITTVCAGFWAIPGRTVRSFCQWGAACYRRLPAMSAILAARTGFFLFCVT